MKQSRQRPTLPHTYAHSTIGGSRLNFRVRNGNGCDPAPMTTGKLAGAAAFQPRAPISVAWGPTGWSVAISRAASACRSSQGISKSWNGVTADPLSTGTAQRRSYRGIVPQQLNTLQTVAPSLTKLTVLH